MDPNFVAAQLPASYATCYLFAPIVGAVVAGTTFNYLDQIMEDMKNDIDDESVDLDRQDSEFSKGLSVKK